MREFASKLHAAGQHWAPIFNPGISVQSGYRAYEEGSAEGVWIKDVNGNPYKGQVGAAHKCTCTRGVDQIRQWQSIQGTGVHYTQHQRW
jgi:hypothetical protein